MNRRFGKNDILLLGMLAVVILVFYVCVKYYISFWKIEDTNRLVIKNRFFFAY